MSTNPYRPLTKVVDYQPEMQIMNMAAMPSGLGCKYLECITHHSFPDILIAYSWRRKVPFNVAPYHVVVTFK